MTTETLTFFYVRLPEHFMTDPQRALRHADETVQVAGGHFTLAGDGTYAAQPDGTYEVRALSWSNTDTVRTMLTQHEGLIIDHEEQHPRDFTALFTDQP